MVRSIAIDLLCWQIKVGRGEALELVLLSTSSSLALDCSTAQNHKAADGHEVMEGETNSLPKQMNSGFFASRRNRSRATDSTYHFLVDGDDEMQETQVFTDIYGHGVSVGREPGTWPRRIVCMLDLILFSFDILQEVAYVDCYSCAGCLVVL